MSVPPNLWDENPLKTLAQQSLASPAMYLIALREHLNSGRKMIDEVVELVSESFPQPVPAYAPADSGTMIQNHEHGSINSLSLPQWVSPIDLASR